MQGIRIHVQPTPTPNRGPRTEPLLSHLTLQNATALFEDDKNRADLIIVWHEVENEIHIQARYGQAKANAIVKASSPPQIKIQPPQASQYTLVQDQLPHECTTLNKTTTSGHVAGLLAILTTGLAGADYVEKTLHELALYASSDANGECTPPPLYPLDLKAHVLDAINMVEKALSTLQDLSHQLIQQGLVPQVGINIVQAPPPPYHTNPANHVGIPTRIVPTRRGLTTATRPQSGGSRHLARALVTYMEYYPDTRSVVNLAYSEKFIKKARARGLRVSSYDRKQEPPSQKAREGSTMQWGVRMAIEKCVEKPQLIYHRGDWGKEPMVNLYERNALAIVDLLQELL